MTEATQTANSNDARQASMSRVETQETILAKLNPPSDAKDPAEATQEQNKEEGESKAKKGAAERIQELVNKRREAETKAEAAERENAELKARIEALSIQPKPIEDSPRPQRSQYATDEEYTDAVADWKMDRKLAKRDQELEQARQEAVQRELEEKWTKGVNEAKKLFSDFDDVVGANEVKVPEYMVVALRKSQVGPQALYYLSLHQDEARRYASLDAIDGIKRFRDLERELVEVEKGDPPPSKKAEETPKVQQSKAPKPIEPVRGVPSGSSAGTDFESYRARRKAQQAEQRR